MIINVKINFMSMAKRKRVGEFDEENTTEEAWIEMCVGDNLFNLYFLVVLVMVRMMISCLQETTREPGRRATRTI